MIDDLFEQKIDNLTNTEEAKIFADTFFNGNEYVNSRNFLMVVCSNNIFGKLADNETCRQHIVDSFASEFISPADAPDSDIFTVQEMLTAWNREYFEALA